MKFNNYFLSSLIAGSALLSSSFLTSCGSDDNPQPDPTPVVDSKNIDYSSENADSWHNYSVKVAELLARDSQDLYDSWNKAYEGGASYSSIFKTASAPYTSYLNCIEEILDGCSDIANEVGEAKIGDPYDLFTAGRREEALYAVESWYSWHSRDDYSNNILSIRNSYLGSLDGTENEASMAALVKSENPQLDSDTRSAITAAYDAILAIPQPFRNNINCQEARTAMEACADLDNLLTKRLKPFFQNLDTSFDSELEKIVENYTDRVVLPTYQTLCERNNALLKAVKDLSSSRTDENFRKAANAWLLAREPWEKSEAFLFGPVDALGLDPNMDSWPLDQDAIVNHLKSGNFSDLEWGNGDDDSKVEAAQNIRGFHTLEFLLFKDGAPRKIE
ncbi:MAG: peptidase M75, partial [Muribaculaceae bacterium]|nr:peptidase M75 [Muribaculaceae bacterium]